jgi:hypothetical protein
MTHFEEKGSFFNYYFQLPPTIVAILDKGATCWTTDSNVI